MLQGENSAMDSSVISRKQRSFFRIFSRRDSFSNSASEIIPRQRSKSVITARSRAISNVHQPQIPQEIHDNIIRFLRLLHEEEKETTCSTCLARDLSAYSLVCTSWHNAVIPHMYERIWISGAESSATVKRAKKKSKETGRAAALLGTLKARPDYAVHVKVLKLPEYNRDTTPEAEALKLLGTAASIVQCTPNLERYLGPYSNVGGALSNVVNEALSGCIGLREQVLMFVEDKGEKSMLERSRKFAQMHERWVNLETLVLQGCGMEPDVDFVGAFVKLPKLKHLMISHFRLGESAALALQAIPESVNSLRLDNLQGLTGRALHAFAISRGTKGLESLTLVNIRMTLIQDLVSLFKLPNLTSLTIADSLDMPYFDETEFTSETIGHISNNVFCSSSLKKLHWDILVHPLAETALANSISGGKLPALRTLRAPSDRTGILQAVCKPLEGISLPSDFIYESPTHAAYPSRTLTSQVGSISSTISRPQSHKSNFLSPSSIATSPNLSRRSSIASQLSAGHSTASPSVATLKAFGKSKPEFQPFPRTLNAARLRAQKRIERARQDTYSRIIITEDKITKETITLKGYMGDVRSNILYSLIPDSLGLGGGEEDIRVGRRESALVNFESDILEGGWRREVDVGSGIGKGVCNGGWNIYPNGKRDKKSLGKVLHEERRKVEPGKIGLDKLF